MSQLYSLVSKALASIKTLQMYTINKKKKSIKEEKNRIVLELLRQIEST